MFKSLSHIARFFEGLGSFILIGAFFLSSCSPKYGCIDARKVNKFEKSKFKS